MDHLTTLDVGYLKAEDANRHVSLAVGGLAVIEGPVPDQDALVAALARRIRHCPRFGQRLQLRPFDLGAPAWVEDFDFDIGRHVRRIAVPQPGDDRELFRLIADVMARRLERDRPLWEIWVIEGLTEDRWAMLTKVHRCMAERMAVGHMLAGLCDDGVSDGLARHIRAAGQQNATGWRQAVSDAHQLDVPNGLWKASTAITAAAARAAQGAAEIAAGVLRPAASPLNGPIGDLRRYGGARAPLADIEQICQAFDVSIDDVALAAITESYRNVLIKRGERPRPDSLRTLVPVSSDSADNRVSIMLPYLPVDEENPVDRLRTVHSRMSQAKAGGQRQAGNALRWIANRVPFPLTAWTVGLLTRLPQRGVVTVATNMPGPHRPLWVMGRRVLGIFPIPPIAMQLRTGVAMLSYADDLFFGVLADYDAVGDVDELARGIEAAVVRLVAAGKRRKAPPSRGGLSLVV